MTKGCSHHQSLPAWVSCFECAREALFRSEPEPGTVSPDASAPLPYLASARTGGLSARQAAHRWRMLAHLAHRAHRAKTGAT